MLDYNNWPYGANQQTNQLLQTMLNNQPQASTHIVKVNGRPGAEAFKMLPNSDILLLDETAPIIWFAQTDGAGYKTLQPYDISPHKEVTPEDKFTSIETRLARLEEAINDRQSNTSGSNWTNNPKQQRNDASNRSNAQG